jgi:hypothetical protein
MLKPNVPMYLRTGKTGKRYIDFQTLNTNNTIPEKMKTFFMFY